MICASCPAAREKKAIRGRRLAGGGQLLALKVRELGLFKPQLAGLRLGRHYLGPGGVEILLRRGLPHLLHEDEAGDQDEGPKHRSNS